MAKPDDLRAVEHYGYHHHVERPRQLQGCCPRCPPWEHVRATLRRWPVETQALLRALEEARVPGRVRAITSARRAQRSTANESRKVTLKN
jgi:hypothetical protein